MKIQKLLPAALLILAACNSKTETKTEAADTTATAPATEAAADTAAVQTDAVVTLTPTDKPKAEPGKPAVIDFSATWCGPCQQFKPIYHKVAGEYAQKATFYTADLDECEALGREYNVTSIPCIVILVDGKEPVSQVGFMTDTEFKALLDKSL